MPLLPQELAAIQLLMPVALVLLFVTQLLTQLASKKPVIHQFSRTDLAWKQQICHQLIQLLQPLDPKLTHLSMLSHWLQSLIFLEVYGTTTNIILLQQHSTRIGSLSIKQN